MGNLINLFATTIASEFDANKSTVINEALQMIDNGLAGKLDISTTGGTTTLTGTPAAPQAQNMLLNVSGTLTSNATIEIPVAAGTGRNRIYIVKNGTSGAFTLTVKKVGGTGVIIGQGLTEFLYYDGSDITFVFGGGQTWSPTWTNLTPGNATTTAKFRTIGKTVICRLNITLGSTSSVSGTVSFTLPLTSVSYAGTANTQPLGIASYFDNSAGDTFDGTVSWSSTTTATLRALDASGTYLKRAVLSSTIPFSWTNPDEITLWFVYEAA